MATNQEMAVWGDPAMYTAEKIIGDGPSVTLIDMTWNPLGVMAAAAELYEGRVVRDPGTLDQEKITAWFTAMTQTKLAAPLEFVHFHFLIEGVTRAFTHQLVRQRTAVYVQESMRFAVKEDFPVARPPSLAGLPDDHPWVQLWQSEVDHIGATYLGLINAGMPAEDARSLAPTNVLTRVHYGTNLRNLADHAGNRLCTQAQFEWRIVWAQMIKAIREYGEEKPHWREFRNQRWQRELICSLFKPVCFQTGGCAFDSSADRTCSIRPRVKTHQSHGVPPSQWRNIHDAEWLADPGAAR